MKIYKITIEKGRLRRRGEIQQPDVLYISNKESLKKAVDIFNNIESIEVINVLDEDKFDEIYNIDNPIG